jgi:hypothetical protein
MATLTTVDGVEVFFNAEGVAAVAPDGGGAAVYGVTQAALRLGESPQGFLNRVGIAPKFAQLTRPDGSPVWISGAAVSAMRPPLPNEYPSDAHAVVFTGPLTQAVRETPAAARTALNGHGGKL